MDNLGGRHRQDHHVSQSVEVASSKVKFPDQVYVQYPPKPPEATAAAIGMAQKRIANSVATRVPDYSTSSLAERPHWPRGATGGFMTESCKS